MAGTVYTVAPIPPDPEHTTYVDAGALRFGVEWRLLDDAELAANYEGADMEEIQAALDGAAVQDNGVSIHVESSSDGHECLRFDCFENAPHYHYIDRSGEKQTIVEFDPVAMGDMLAWALAQLRTGLAPMLEHAGGGDLVGALDRARIESALSDVEALALRAKAALDAQKRG